MLVDTDYCLACGCQLDDSERAYCSSDCEAADRAPPQLTSTHAHAHAHSHHQQPPSSALELDAEPELEPELELELAPLHSYHRARFASIDRWREQVPLHASPDERQPLRAPSTSSLASSPTGMLLSASVLAPPCLALPTLPLPPTHRLLPPATDIESLCPPTLALTVDDSLVVTPPTQSVAAPVAVAHHHHQSQPHAIAPLKWVHDRLRSWTSRHGGGEKEKDPLPVGAEAATFYSFAHDSPTLTRSQPLPVPSPPRAAAGGHYHFAGCAHCDAAVDSHCH